MGILSYLLISINREEVLKRLTGLKVDKLPGLDGMQPRLLWEARVQIVKALATIFQSSLDIGVVPEDRRVANVTPLYKKGQKDKLGNYRPVSLTSVVGKLLEQILSNKSNRMFQ
uniref:Reverse transcriptase domain-containing protein n=1 Tax=Callorhinchus milii TaxID=7868 RepID=A0A4W3GB81_CALMI